MAPAAIKKLTDEQLVNLYLNGNNHALGNIYERYFRKVYYKCFSITKNTDDALDYAQDIIVKAFDNIQSFKGDSKFSTWLYAITHNYCITQVTKNKKLQFENVYSFYDLQDDYLDYEDKEERINRENKEIKLQEYLNEIPPADKILLDLKYRKNYSIKELQLELNLSASAIKMRLMRARQKVEYIYNLQYN